jgi:pimeloyl-ACP methyl ester carboxylesterase/acyl dehydratase
MPFQRVNNVQIYYEEYGTGYPVLLIQGLGYPSGMWFLQTPELARRYRTIVFDNRGVGRSGKPDEEYTVALMANDAAELLRVLGIGKAHVVGVSLGGYIAQDLALNRPHLVDHLVLIATSSGGPHYLELTKAVWDKVASLAGLPPEEVIRRGMALATTEAFYRKRGELIDRSVSIRLENPQPPYAFSRQFAAASRFDSTDRAPLITQPTLILGGAQDQVMPLALIQELARKIPSARLVVFPDAAHLVFLEKAPDVNQAILAFLPAPGEIQALRANRGERMEKGRTIDRLEVGQTYHSTVVITAEMIDRFAQSTGDHNPIHIDEDYAKETTFKSRVAHGMLLAGILSGLLGTRFPGMGTVYLSQTLKFIKPVFIGDEITMQLRVLECFREKNRVRIETLCLNQRGDTVLAGEALVMPPR